MPHLPPYQPPSDQRASVATGIAPILVLLGFASIVTRLIDPLTGFALFAACAAWVAHELHQYQRSIDRYNLEYVQLHLDSRSSETLLALVEAEPRHAPTRDFVQRFVTAGRKLWLDGPTL